MKPRILRTLGSSVRHDLQVIRSEIDRLRFGYQRQATIDAYLRSHAVRGLHIGAGGNILAGWLNTDLEPQRPEIIYLDVTDPLPFDANTIDFVYSEHLFEHLRHEEGAFHLRECFRVLKPNGRVRVATPDLQFLIDIYTQPSHSEAQSKYVNRILAQAFPATGFYHGAFVLNHFVKHWGHQFIYDEVTLGGALRSTGFSQLRRWPVGQSDEPMLQNIEHHGDAIGDEFNRLQTIVLEGTKGSAA
jgi:predicted SAM-dependent methyltransferase